MPVMEYEMATQQDTLKRDAVWYPRSSTSETVRVLVLRKQGLYPAPELVAEFVHDSPADDSGVTASSIHESRLLR